MTVPDSDDLRFPIVRISNIALVAFVVASGLALRRWETYHNETFDLAFYARLVWGLGHGDQYQPLTNSYLWGLHASPVLFMLGYLGRVLPIVPMLLVLQAASVFAAAIPLARIALRRVGHRFAPDLMLVAFLLFPTISTITTYEFHPSALALFPLALGLDYFDQRRARAGGIVLALAALCREDVALIAGFMGLALALRPECRRTGLLVFVAGVAWFCVYMFVIAPRHLPRHGSLQLHYGPLGGSPSSVARALLLHPLATLKTVLTPAKILYVPRLLLPVAFLSLLAPRWLIPVIPVLAINLLSSFPTAVQIQSHYAALAVPFVLAAAAHGAGRLAASEHRYSQAVLLVAALAVGAGSLHMHRRAGASPISRHWNGTAFRHGPRTAEMRDLLSRVPSQASIAAPDAVLPHVAERPLIARVPSRRPMEFTLLSTEYRRRFAGTQQLWRSEEEIGVRNLLAGSTYGVYAATAGAVLFRLGHAPRAFATGRYVETPPTDGIERFHLELGPSMTLAGFGLAPSRGGTVVTLLLVATSSWPHDLGMEVGWGPMHPNGDRQDPQFIVAFLPFDGLFSPVHVRRGEMTRTQVFVTARDRDLVDRGLYFGARRIDGSRLDSSSPHWVRLHPRGALAPSATPAPSTTAGPGPVDP